MPNHSCIRCAGLGSWIRQRVILTDQLMVTFMRQGTKWEANVLLKDPARFGCVGRDLDLLFEHQRFML